MTNSSQIVAFQGVKGAYSHQAALEVFPEADVLPCNSFQGTIAAVQEGRADIGMLPVENSTYGRVADIHQLLPASGLKIAGEHFVRVNINLHGLPGAKLSDITHAMSHAVLLGQCRAFLAEHKITPVVGADTAGSAKDVAERGDKSMGALSSPLAGGIYGLETLAEGIEDQANNTTRFLVTQREAAHASFVAGETITTFVFRVRNLPAALYKALGGFATNGVNMVKLESYMIGGSFTATQFYADIIGHPEEPATARALEELGYFTDYLEILGVYRADAFRKGI